MKSFVISRIVELSNEEAGLIKFLYEEGWQWNYACDEYALKIFDSIVRKGLASEDSDGRVMLNGDGRQIAQQI